MPRPSLAYLLLGLTMCLSACQLAGNGGFAGAVTPNAVAGDAIEVTALDAPAPAATNAGVRRQTEAPPPAAEPPQETASEPAPKPDLAEAGATKADATAADETAADATATQDPAAELAEPLPEAVKSAPQIACEKKKGRWVKAGSVLFACVFDTRDGGKSCSRESQCDGECLARSGTCAPIKPLLGCNEILQDDGARVTLCID